MDVISPTIQGLAAIVLFSGFIKIATALSIFRVGLGLHGAGFGVITIGVAFALSLVVSHPNLPSPDASLELLSPANPAHTISTSFLEEQSDPKLRARFSALQAKPPALKVTAEAPPTEKTGTSVLVASFVVTQVRDAFMLGAMFLIPFVVIDLLVANLLMTLGMLQLPALVVSFPIKLVLFLAVDGWGLLSEKLLKSFL